MAGASNSNRLSRIRSLEGMGGDDGLRYMSKSKGSECMGCGIMVEDGYMETRLHQVGDYQICGWCRRQLEKRGRLQVQPYNSHQYLYPDGQVVINKSTLRGDENGDEAERKQVAG
jgi:hypothetical protein